MKKKNEELRDDKHLRRIAEEMLDKQKNAYSFGLSESDILKLNHELAVHQIELEIQNKELIEAKENLENVIEKYAGLYDFAPTGYLTLSTDGKIIELNFYTAKLLGKERRNLINNYLMIFLENDSKLIFKKFLNEIFQNQEKQTCEVSIINQENQVCIVYLVGFMNKNGNLADINLIDITERKKAEEKLHEVLNEFAIANRELELSLQQNSDKDLFISVLAHDLRNPFGVLLGYTDLLSENLSTLGTDEIKNYVEEIWKSSHDTYLLLEDLLKWSRVRSGKIPFDIQKLNFSDICKEVVETHRSNAQKKNINIICSSNEDLIFMADEDMIKAIFRNLVTNSIKFTAYNGTIRISAQKNETGITFSVYDNGIGIEKERIPKLFNISQFHTTKGTQNEKGTGLGLFLCKEFVEKHGGKIWVESEEGKASTFCFNIPEHFTGSSTHFLKENEDENQQRKLKVLIADDDPALRMVLSNLIADYGREILFADNGIDAVKAYRDNPDTDLILMDYHMPGLNGYDAANQIRTISKDVVIIVETADTYSDLLIQSSREGINDFFFKPYNREFLSKLIKKYFYK